MLFHCQQVGWKNYFCTSLQLCDWSPGKELSSPCKSGSSPVYIQTTTNTDASILNFQARGNHEVSMSCIFGMDTNRGEGKGPGVRQCFYFMKAQPNAHPSVWVAGPSTRAGGTISPGHPWLCFYRKATGFWKSQNVSYHRGLPWRSNLWPFFQSAYACLDLLLCLGREIVFFRAFIFFSDNALFRRWVITWVQLVLDYFRRWYCHGYGFCT